MDALAFAFDSRGNGADDHQESLKTLKLSVCDRQPERRNNPWPGTPATQDCQASRFLPFRLMHISARL
jgi:hypothetical protein